LRFLTEVGGFLVLLAEFALVPAVFDIAEKLDADLVRIEIAGRHVNGAAVVIGVVDDLLGFDEMLGHQRAMPEAVMVHEALCGIAVALLNRDIEYIRLAMLDQNNLVGP